MYQYRSQSKSFTVQGSKTDRKLSPIYQRLLISFLVAMSQLLGNLPAQAASPAPGTVIENQASGTFVDTTDNTTKTMESNIVQVTIGEVAGVTVTPMGYTGAVVTGGILYFDFLVANEGNDPTQFYLPDAPSALNGGTLAGPIQIISYDADGSGSGAAVDLTPNNITVPQNSDGATTGTLLGSLPSSINVNKGSVPVGGTITVRVPVTVSATGGQSVIVILGNTDGSATTQNQDYIESTPNKKDLYTYDNSGTTNGDTTGDPLNGDVTYHRKEASASQTVTVLPGISGTVFEDVNYGGGAGRSLSSSGGLPRPGVTVELYKSSDGSFVSSTATDVLGKYNFNVPTGLYWVRVVNNTVSSSRPGGCATPVNTATCTQIPVQTFRTDASSGIVSDITNRIGGEKPNEEDAPAQTGTLTYAALNALPGRELESVTSVNVGIAGLNGIDFGFNFDTIINTSNTGQGSLRQFIINSNALGNAGLDQVPNPSPAPGTTAVNPNPGEETSIFMIPATALSSNVANITITTQLPPITDTFTTISGLTQTANIGNTNTGQQGTGGTVGTDGLTLSTVDKPEIQIVGTNIINNGLTVQGANTTIRGIAIFGFGNAVSNGNIVVSNNVSSTLIEQNFLGSTAASFSNPANRTKGSNIALLPGAKNGVVQNNLVGYADLFGLLGTQNNQGWKIENNEVRDNSFNDPNKDGMSFESGSTGNLVRGNLIISQGGNGVDSWNASGALTIENNTITGNGQGSTANLGETPGIRLYGVGNRVYRNIIHSNYGAGVMVTAASTRNLISQNSIYANGTIPATNGSAASGQIGIDLLTSTDNSSTGTSSYVSANDGIVTSSANRGVDYPILTSASLVGTSLTVSGFIGNTSSGNAVFANATLEFFISEGTNQNRGEVISGDGKSLSHGEGKTYIGSCNADSLGKFSCTLTGVTGLSDPKNITATATDINGNTSEFSATVSNPNVLLVKRITAINGNRTKNPNDNTPLNTTVDDATLGATNDTLSDTDPNWPLPTSGAPAISTFLKGAVNAGQLNPGDTIEYTIYFLNTGGTDAKNVKICDRILGDQVFLPAAYGAGNDIQLQIGGSGSILGLTQLDDNVDRGAWLPSNTPPSNCNLQPVPVGVANNGAIAVQITGTGHIGQPDLAGISGATAPGTPGSSYGFIRFTTKVKTNP
jgi:trimeric autotransporter adhesin